ncbi:hypothetical protein T190_32270 [Sinorhizobium meliloti CCBAU 01290]|nr:hypothetical protein T190_32270 [Sinorhizobium meliloti CCBAU 01290]
MLRGLPIDPGIRDHFFHQCRYYVRDLRLAPSAGLAAKFALAAIVVAITVYGILAPKAALDDLKAMLDDAVDDFSGSSFGARLKQIPTALFTGATIVLVLAMGVTQLWAIIAA